MRLFDHCTTLVFKLFDSLICTMILRGLVIVSVQFLYVA